MNYYKMLNRLNTYNFLFILDICIDIDNEYQKHLNSNFDFEVYGENNFDIISKTKLDDDPMLEEHESFFYRRLESLTFLQNLDVLISYKSDQNPDDVICFANIELVPTKFEELKIILTQIYHERYTENHPVKTKFGCFLDHCVEDDSPAKVSTEIKTTKELYCITFPLSNEIILNDLVVLSKPNLNSENAEVFGYLMENPNRTIQKKEIEERIGQPVGKDLHKIVENLGFSGNLRKAFFKVSNKAILFRNPVTKTAFDQLGIPPLRINKKA